jgi:1-deoxy-D-xylulose-5-phosphate synthase
LLAQLQSPVDLRKLLPAQLPSVADELRHFILDAVSRYGGHLGASLGTVELTIAIHYVFQTPYDQLIWDVGHQAYGHKILCERRDSFVSNRRKGGISGFPKRSESVYDSFGTGHASTSISAALGMALAAKLKNENRNHLAVIGDGALTGGMAFEALNQAAVEDVRLLIVINDNAMSIDPNVGGLLQHLQKLRTGSNSGPNWFENLGIRYQGPIDGHDLTALLTAFTQYREKGGVQILHITTTKGKGYPLAEQNQVKWHAPGLFDKISGQLQPDLPEMPGPRYQEVLGDTLLALAKENPSIYAITPAMPSGSGLVKFMQTYPERSRDVGIAEQHAVTLAAGLATAGFTPFCAIYSSFLQRAYDQLIHDVALQNLAVVFCIDRAGLVGADGPTHHGAFDLAYLRAIPNLVVAAPRNAAELRNLLYTASHYKKGPFAIRYPRGNSPDLAEQKEFTTLTPGKGVLLKEGKKAYILSVGPTASLVESVLADFPEVGHIDLRFVKPLDTELLTLAAQTGRILTLEDGCLTGGVGEAVASWLAQQPKRVKISHLGIPDQFIEQGTVGELWESVGLSEENLRLQLLLLLKD